MSPNFRTTIKHQPIRSILGKPKPLIFLTCEPPRTDIFIPLVNQIPTISDINQRLTCFATFNEKDTEYIEADNQPLGSKEVNYVLNVVRPDSNIDKDDPEVGEKQTAEIMEYITEGDALQNMKCLHDPSFEISAPIFQFSPARKRKTIRDLLSESPPEKLQKPTSSDAHPINIYHEYPLSKPPNAPRFLNYMMFVNEIVLCGSDRNKLIIHKPFTLYQHKFDCIKPEAWLQDDIVDFYLALLRSRNQTDQARYTNAYMFKCSFYSLLSSPEGLEAVKLAADGTNIFTYEVILFPVCVNDHWRLVVVCVANRTVSVFNSVNGNAADKLIAEDIISYLKAEYTRVVAVANDGGTSEEVQPEWIPNLNLDIPQQGNGHDCGVCLLVNAEYLCRTEDLNYTSDHLTYFRAKILYECISGRLLKNDN